MAIDKIDVLNVVDGRGLSSTIWHDCPRGVLGVDNNDGVFLFDDFVLGASAWNSYTDTGVTLTTAAGESYGALEVAGNDADNDEGTIQSGGLAAIDSSAGKKVWFEARFKKASIANNALAVFLGLAEPGLAAADTLVDNTGEVADKDLIGFQTLHADGDALVFCYRKAGQTKQTVSLDSDSSVLTADTYVKVGLKYDPSADSDERIKIYVDGVEQANAVTSANISAATFPDGELLAALVATKVGAAAESKCQIDWIAVGVE